MDDLIGELSRERSIMKTVLPLQGGAWNKRAV